MLRSSRSRERHVRRLAWAFGLLLVTSSTVGCAGADGPMTIELACPKDWTVRWSEGAGPYWGVLDSEFGDRPLERYLECRKLDERAGWTHSPQPPKGWDVEFVLPPGSAKRGGRTGGSATVRVRVFDLASVPTLPPELPATNPRSRLIAQVIEN